MIQIYYESGKKKGRKKPLVSKMSSCAVSFCIKERRLGYVEKRKKDIETICFKTYEKLNFIEMKKKLIILSLFSGVIFALTLSDVDNTNSQIDLASLIIQNAAADGEYSSEGCKYKVNYTCWADDGSVWLNCQERVLFSGTCNL